MKKTIFLLLFSLSLFAQAPTSFQYGVRTPTLFPWNGANKIDVNGRLKLNTTAGGFIPAAMTTTQRLAVASPQTGESVYDVTLGKYYHWDGSAWVVSGGSGGNLAATLALDNKTNSIPITSNDGTSSLTLDDSGNITLDSNSSDKQIVLSSGLFLLTSDNRIDIDGKGINMNTASDGLGLPRVTTTAMNAIVAPTEGMLVRNTTESSIYQYNGTAWEPLDSTAPTLPEHQIAFGQVGDVFGSDSTLTYEGGTLSINGVDALTTANGQPIDSDLTDISSLAPPNDNILQRKAGAWTSRTPAQFKTDLSLGVADVSGAQATLVSGTSIKTLNSVSLLGSGNINVGVLQNPLSQFASTTSSELAGVLSNESGSGLAVFNDAPTLTNPIVGTQSANDNSTKAASTAYADGKVQNSMAASTTVAPSATAVSTEYNSASALTFSGPIDLSKKGGSYYAEHTQTGAITFSVSATTVGGLAQVTIISNGNAINLVGGWVNVGGEPVSTVSGTTNYMVIWQTNNKVFYSVKVY